MAEPVYMDLGFSPTVLPQSPAVFAGPQAPSTTTTTRSPLTYREPVAMASGRPPRGPVSTYQPFESPDKQQPVKITDYTPILFSDVDSQTTGMSQQELLKRKAREDSKRQRRRNSKKKPILNLPAVLTRPRYYAPHHVEDTGTGKVTKKPSNASRVEHLLQARRMLEEVSTASNSSASPSGAPYSTVLPPALIMSERDDASLLETWAVRPAGDLESVDSFPILGTRAGGFSVASEDKPPSVRISVVRESQPQHPAGRLREVRFSSKLVDEEIPWDESEDGSPTSVAERPSPPPKEPKSILRPTRFAGPAPTRVLNMQRYRRALMDDRSTITPRTMISLSPPPGGAPFVDKGVELSPIRRDQKSNVSFSSMVQRAACLSPDPALVEDGSLYSDPTLDIVAQLHAEDDSTVASTMKFIKAVASIVIQTAWRRYHAMCLYEQMRRQQPSSALQRLPAPIRATPAAPDLYQPLAERMYHLAAIRIQSVFRGFWVRDCLSIDHYCAKVIQQIYRGHQCRRQYEFDIYRIVTVQSVWRRALARLRVAHSLWYTIYLQSLCRGYLVRQRYADYVGDRQARQLEEPAMDHAAATMIQSQWRAFACESDFIRQLVDILIVQSIIRRWLACRRAQSVPQANKSRRLYPMQKKKTITAPKKPVSKPVRSTPKAPVYGAIHRQKPAYIETQNGQFCLSPGRSIAAIESFEFEEGSHRVPIVSPTFSDHESPAASTGGAKSVLSLWQEREKKNMNRR